MQMLVEHGAHAPSACPALPGVDHVLHMTRKTLDAAECHARRGFDQLRQRECRCCVNHTGAALADIDIDQHLQRTAAGIEQFMQHVNLIGVIDDDADIGLVGDSGQTRELRSVGHRRGQQQPCDASLRKGLDLGDCRAGDAHSAGLDLQLRDARRLVSLGMRAKRNAMFALANSAMPWMLR
jgi:hypothetical protein